ncbi:MAG: hypothetical protein HN423_07745 [Alphaproteobacteria bacterium]|nr:hypothetical protein [Alphaproteobacteria bacterium]
MEKVSAPTADWGNADLDAMGLREISTSSRLLSLFTDPDTGEITYLTGVSPFKSESSPERHPVGQEFYILGGSLAGVGGVMQAGAYCWRPPLVTHGPYGSPTGALIILRSVGGPLTKWNPLSHDEYWADPDQAEPIAHHIYAILNPPEA